MVIQKRKQSKDDRKERWFSSVLDTPKGPAGMSLAGAYGKMMEFVKELHNIYLTNKLLIRHAKNFTFFQKGA